MSLRIAEDDYKALCRRVMDRDGWRCRNPRCGMRNNLNCHHIIYRSEQGEDVSWNLITLCSDCHEKIHRYELYILVAEGNWVGEGGGADGRVLFWEEQ
jgi:5-methylcytosine-specific restriction endonuclease McrA